MNGLRISEAVTVQFPMVRHAAEIGWTPLAPDVAKLKRGGEAGMLLRDELETKLAEFNPWLTRDADRAIVETLDAVPPTIEGNREMLAWLRGEKAGTTKLKNAIAALPSSTSSTRMQTSFMFHGNGQ